MASEDEAKKLRRRHPSVNLFIGSSIAREAGRASAAPSPNLGWQLDAHWLYPGVIRVSGHYRSQVWSILLNEVGEGKITAWERAKLRVGATRARRGRSQRLQLIQRRQDALPANGVLFRFERSSEIRIEIQDVLA